MFSPGSRGKPTLSIDFSEQHRGDPSQLVSKFQLLLHFISSRTKLVSKYIKQIQQWSGEKAFLILSFLLPNLIIQIGFKNEFLLPMSSQI